MTAADHHVGRRSRAPALMSGDTIEGVAGPTSVSATARNEVPGSTSAALAGAQKLPTGAMRISPVITHNDARCGHPHEALRDASSRSERSRSGGGRPPQTPLSTPSARSGKVGCPKGPRTTAEHQGALATKKVGN